MTEPARQSRSEPAPNPGAEYGAESIRVLKGLDAVAYVRFASVYRNFRDVGEFKKQLEELLKRKKF